MTLDDAAKLLLEVIHQTNRLTPDLERDFRDVLARCVKELALTEDDAHVGLGSQNE